MNEIDFVVGVFISSGAGYLLGKHLERQKARRAFRHMMHQAAHSTSVMFNVMVDVIVKRIPDVSKDDLVQEVLAACNKFGIEAVAFKPGQTQPVTANDNKAE